MKVHSFQKTLKVLKYLFSHIKDWQVMKIFCFHFEQNLLGTLHKE